MNPNRILHTVCACICVVAVGCGEDPKVEPSQRDVEAIATSVGDVVYQCRSVASGFIESPDGSQLKRDVDILLDMHSRVDPDATFDLPGQGATSLRDQLRLVDRQLEDGCSREQAERLQEAVDG
jgi:hypothetical protein